MTPRLGGLLTGRASTPLQIDKITSPRAVLRSEAIEMFSANGVSKRYYHIGDVPSELQLAVDPPATVKGKDTRVGSRERFTTHRKTRGQPKPPCTGSTSAGGTSTPRGQYSPSRQLDDSDEANSDCNAGPVIRSRRMPLGKIAPHVALQRIQRCVARTSVKLATALPMVRKPVIEARISRWLMDTGSGLDLVSKSDVRNMKHMVVASENPVMLATAN